MKFTISTTELKSAWARLESLYASGLGLWDMEVSILAKDGGDSVIIECAGGGVYYQESVEATIESGGQFGIPIATIKELRFPGKSTTFWLKDSVLSFFSDRMKGKLESIRQRKGGLAQIEFSGKDALRIPAKLFNSLVESIAFKPTVADTAMKVRFVADNSKQRFRVYCADTWRLARYEWNASKGQPRGPEKNGSKPSKAKDDGVDVSSEIVGDFDYVFDSKFLSSIRNFFDGTLKIAADAKTIKFSDGKILLYCPSLQEEVGAQVDSLITEQNGLEPVATLRLLPGYVLNLIKSACSASKADNTSLTLIPRVESKSALVRVADDKTRIQCTLDLLAASGKSETPVNLHAVHFAEFLDLIRGFADESKGCYLKIWPKLVGLSTKESIFMMPTMD